MQSATLSKKLSRTSTSQSTMIKLDRKEAMSKNFKDMFWMSSSFQRKGSEDLKKCLKELKMS